MNMCRMVNRLVIYQFDACKFRDFTPRPSHTAPQNNHSPDTSHTSKTPPIPSEYAHATSQIASPPIYFQPDSATHSDPSGYHTTPPSRPRIGSSGNDRRAPPYSPGRKTPMPDVSTLRPDPSTKAVTNVRQWQQITSTRTDQPTSDKYPTTAQKRRNLLQQNLRVDE